MSQLRDPLPNHQHIAVMGLGASGQAATRLLHAFGKRIRAIDINQHIDLDKIPDEVDIALGTNDPGDAQVVILSPGLNPMWPENRDRASLQPLWSRVANGSIQLISEIELAARAFTGHIIAVGGTDGKSTTAAFTAHLLKTLGVPHLLGGNSWTALSDVVLEAKDVDTAVIEVSAFQLWEGHQLIPDAAILTNIARDHLDHFETFDDYVRAKWQLLAHASDPITAVLNHEDEQLMDGMRDLEKTGANIRLFGASAPDVDTQESTLIWAPQSDAEKHTIDLSQSKLPGAHNRRNIAAALLAVAPLVSSSTKLAAAVEQTANTFRGLPHRMEHVRTIGGSRFLNDSKATNVHAACIALHAMDEGVVCIIGGVDKKLDLTPLLEALQTIASHIIVLGELKPRFMDESSHLQTPRHEVDSLASAVSLANKLSQQSGKDILFSPACSSFDMFDSFEHRGDEFVRLVRALPDNH